MKLPDDEKDVFKDALFVALFLCACVIGSSLDYENNEPWTRDTVHLATVSGVNSYCPPQDGLTLASEVTSTFCRSKGEYK